jgi:cytidylate kinase
MGNLLLKYMQDRYEKVEFGPVITISREFGCPAKYIAKKLAEELSKIKNADNQLHNWKWISKEILEESAKELNLHPSKIENILNTSERGAFYDLLNFLSSKYYVDDKKIRNKYAQIIRSFAEQGNVVVVGRASGIITRDINKSLQIRLQAPLDWRAEGYSQRHNMIFEDAKKHAIKMDEKRSVFRKYFEGEIPEDDIYDITFNCQDLSIDEIVQIIIMAIKVKSIM